MASLCSALLEAILGSVGARTVLLSPFQAGFGSNVHIGDDFFGNVNLTFVDDVEIRIGKGVMIAPGVTLTTTGHPIHPDLRVDFRRFSEPIVIEDKVWIGSNVVVLPGVRIGFGAVVGAGSVVTHDIPAMTVAVGVPCRVVRYITDEDLNTKRSKLSDGHRSGEAVPHPVLQAVADLSRAETVPPADPDPSAGPSEGSHAPGTTGSPSGDRQ
jgi:galactoside O-acetyltransferase